MFCSPLCWAELADWYFRCVCGSSRGHSPKLPRSCRSRKVAWGVREAALVVLLAPFGAPAALVLATGIVWEGIIIAGGLLAGLTAFLLRRANSRPRRSSAHQ